MTFLFTDIEGSSARWERDGDSMRAAVAGHDAVLRQVISDHEGVVVKHTGDGVMAVFEDAVHAVAAAVDVQRWIDLVPVRIGVHTGRAAPDQQGDYLGLTPTRAARVMEAAHGGQILLSSAATGLALDDLPAGVTLRDLGEHRLRNLEHPERLWQVVHAALRVDFPPPRGTAAAAAGNLPQLRTSVVGRDEERAQLLALLRVHRLVTVTGTGGVGKTTLAVLVAADWEASGGVWFVDLVAAPTGSEVVAVVADALGLRQRNGQTLDRSVLDALSVRDVLLVIDNCEHVAAGVASFIDQVLATGPGVRVLATSRESLGVHGEQLFPLAPLPTDADGAAIRLFIERAQAMRPQLQLGDDDATAVVTICERLDGLPLAIELAAARVRSLSPSELAARLDDRFRLLRSTGRGTGTHHDTLEATIRWSYELLTDPQRRLLERLAVFSGSFDAAAVAGVADDLVTDELDAFDELDVLTAKSLVMPAGSARFHLLVSVQAFALSRLRDRGDADDASARHASYFRELALRLGPLVLDEPGTDAVDQLDDDYPNVVQALDWWSRHDPESALDMLLAAQQSWVVHGHAAELERRGLDLLERLPDLDGVRRAKALVASGTGRFIRGDTKGARPLWKQAIALLAGDDPEYAHTNVMVAQLALFDGETDVAVDRLAFALAHIDVPGPAYYRYATYAMASAVAAWLGDVETARHALDAAFAASPRVSPSRRAPYIMAVALRALDPPRAVQFLHEALDDTIRKDPYAHAATLMQLGFSLLAIRRTTDGCATLSDSLPLLLATGSRRDAGSALDALAAALHRQGQLEAAALGYAAAGRIRDDLGIVGLPGEDERHRHRVRALRQQLGDDRFDTLTRQGGSLAIDQVCQSIDKAVHRLPT